MREIKFRIWDEDNKSLQYSNLSFNNLQTLRESIDTIEDYFSSYYIKENPSYLMQFTGLLDMNGKEIYEGDILGEFGKDHPLGEYKATVIWNTKKAEWYLNKAYCSGQRNLWRWSDKMEVIGNIYQNPELL